MQLRSLSLSLSLSLLREDFTIALSVAILTSAGSMSQIKSARDSGADFPRADFARVHHFTTSPFRVFSSITRFISSPFQLGDRDRPRSRLLGSGQIVTVVNVAVCDGETG